MNEPMPIAGYDITDVILLTFITLFNISLSNLKLGFKDDLLFFKN